MIAEGTGAPLLALSTMWAQQERFRGDFAGFVEVARRAGFEAIEVSHATDEAGLREVLSQRLLPVVSLHAPTPYVDLGGGRSNLWLNLAGLDEQDRDAAVAATRRTIDFAADAGVRSLVVHLGSINQGPRDAEQRLRELYASGEMAGEEAGWLRDSAIAARRADAPPHIEAARRSLAEIVEYARPRGVLVGLETRLHYFEIPAAEEALDLLRDYEPEEAGYWHDTGHAEVWDRLGLFPHGRWFELLGDRLIGSHLHDVRDLRDHRAPGNGTLDWAIVRDGIPSTAYRTCEIDQHEPEPLLADAVRLLRRIGVVAGNEPA